MGEEGTTGLGGWEGEGIMVDDDEELDDDEDDIGGGTVVVVLGVIG